MMGLPFFQKAIELQEQYHSGQVIGNGMQTNGILLNKEWAKFLQRRRFLVGLSIDGPEHAHDHCRFIKGGKGSWSKVCDSAKLLLDSDVEVNALSVVSDYSVGFPEEIYEFLKGLGIRYMQFIPCVEADSVAPSDGRRHKKPDRVAAFSAPAEKLGKFWRKLFDLWLADFKEGIPTTSIRFFDSVFYHYVGLEPPECALLKECGNYVVIEHNGDVYSCDFFVEPTWKLGNIRDDLLIDLLNSKKQVNFGKLKSNLTGKCKKCSWLKYCQGGCLKDRARNPANRELDYFCPAYETFFKHADTHLKKLAIKWKADRAIKPSQDSIRIDSTGLVNH